MYVYNVCLCRVPTVFYVYLCTFVRNKPIISYHIIILGHEIEKTCLPGRRCIAWIGDSRHWTVTVGAVGGHFLVSVVPIFSASCYDLLYYRLPMVVLTTALRYSQLSDTDGLMCASR